MQVPQFLLDLLQLLLDLAVPAAFCTLAAAGVSLRHEGGINFHVNGRTGKWILWTVVLLTLPQLLSWIAAQGINIPSGSGSVGTGWIASMETVFKNFVNQIVVARLVPVLAAYFVLKATLDGASGENPIGSIVAALFLMSLSATMNVPRTYISKVEMGRVMPTLETLGRFGAALGISVAHLLSNDSERLRDDAIGRIMDDPFVAEIAQLADRLDAVHRALILRAVRDAVSDHRSPATTTTISI